MFLFLVLCYNTATGWQPICSWINIIIIIIIIIGFYNRDEKCLQRGTAWGFK